MNEYMTLTLKGLIVLIDFGKALNSLIGEFILKSLKILNCGEKVIKLRQYSTSKILQNGNPSESIPLARGNSYLRPSGPTQK